MPNRSVLPFLSGLVRAFEDCKTRLNSKKQLVSILCPADAGSTANGQTAKPTNPAGAAAPADDQSGE